MNNRDEVAEEISDAKIGTVILDSLAQRNKDASSCPSEIARTLAPKKGNSWRQLMPRVRDVAARLARVERISLTRGTSILSPDHLEGGPIRIRRGRRFV